MSDRQYLMYSDRNIHCLVSRYNLILTLNNIVILLVIQFDKTKF
jgi:hypothetical protein